jgi:hypothetical protein
VKGAVALLGFALASALLAACSREDEKPKVVDLTPGFARVAPVVAEGGASAPPAPKKDLPWPGDVDSAAPPPLQYTITKTIITDSGMRPAKVNPDDAILERARVAAGGCYASLPAAARYGSAERSTHIVFTVIPSGSVSTVNVSSADTTDEGVLSCIRQQALSTAFSDNTGGPLRTYAIDVRVIANGSGGGR